MLLIFADADGLAYAAFVATVALLVSIGFVEAKLRAVLWAVVLVASALVADVLWLSRWSRSIAQTSAR